MSEALVIGHRNPDTDAICSAIGYAEFKRRTGMASAAAARCGDTNDLILTIGAMGLDSFAERLQQYPREKLAVVVGDRWDIQDLAIREGVHVLIVTGGLGVEKKTVEAARKNKVNLLSSPHDTATTAALCRASIAVRHVLNEEFLALNEDASL